MVVVAVAFAAFAVAVAVVVAVAVGVVVGVAGVLVVVVVGVEVGVAGVLVVNAEKIQRQVRTCAHGLSGCSCFELSDDEMLALGELVIMQGGMPLTMTECFAARHHPAMQLAREIVYDVFR